jgi:hypothetical protein
MKGMIMTAMASLSIGAVSARGLSAEELQHRAIERRAAEAVVWAMPAVNAQLMFDAAKEARSGFNQIVYWSRPVTWKNQTLTPNPDTIYLMPLYDTQAGPMVLEIPQAEEGASITGSIDDAWQTALEDVGPAGADKGKGGKYLILPPGYSDKVPEGYIALRSSTYTGFVLLRSNLKSGSEADIDRAVAYGKRVRFYPLAQAASPPLTPYVDAIDVLFDSTIPSDARFFEALDRFVQREPWLERDKAMIDPLRTIGIEKGKPFAPSADTRGRLIGALKEARAWLDLRYLAVFEKPFNPATHWTLPATPEVAEAIMGNYAKSDAYPIDGRAVSYSMAFFSAKHLGEGQYYLMTPFDKSGKPFAGSGSYRLRVPADAPVKLYWSATVYDRTTHALIRNTSHASRGSNTPGLQKNPDGSVDLYFSPKPPAGVESNWVPTDPKGEFEILFRLYGPEKPFFDKTWKLPDVERR